MQLLIVLTVFAILFVAVAALTEFAINFIKSYIFNH